MPVGDKSYPCQHHLKKEENMQIYNTLTRKKEEFQPIRPNGKVSMYACGITAYDLSHIGHARSAVVFDVIARYLRFLNYNLVFVRNFTDVDDKIIKRANEEGLTSQEVAEKYIAAFHEDMDRLNVQRADLEPRATEYISEMIEIIEKLIAQGNAYVTASNDVNFRVRSFKDYGKLSGRNLEDMQAGARIDVDENKEDPMDFVLWKAAKPNEPFWESPWGKGRPGWHIECSAMSEKNLPLPLDIHGGGQDLIFPHHENEIAQSEAALGQEFSRYWMHNGFVQINSEKMSKSLNNFKTIRDILENRQPEVLRFFLITKHYRSPIDFSFEALDEAERGLKRIYECVEQVQTARANLVTKNNPFDMSIFAELGGYIKEFYSAMYDDFNTAAAVGHIFSSVRVMNRALETKKLLNSPDAPKFLDYFLDFIEDWKTILGIAYNNPTEFLESLKLDSAKRLGINIDEVEALLEERKQARLNKDYAKSDEIRDALLAMNVEVKDTPQGQTWTC